MEAGAIATIILGSGVTSSIVNALFTIKGKRNDSTRQNNHLALAFAHLFEQYTYTCLMALDEHDTYESSNGRGGESLSRVPTLPDLPEGEHQYFDIQLLDEIYDFPQQIDFANVSVTTVANYVGGDEAFDECYKSTLELTRTSLSLADKIRARYKLKPRALSFGSFSMRDRLREKENR